MFKNLTYEALVQRLARYMYGVGDFTSSEWMDLGFDYAMKLALREWPNTVHKGGLRMINGMLAMIIAFVVLIPCGTLINALTDLIKLFKD